MKLTDNEIRDINRYLEAGKPLPEKYRFLLFEDKREVELDQGWKYHPKRNDDKKQRNCLIPFSPLKDDDKNKNRDQVRHYPDFAGGSGLKIVFARL